MKKRISFVGCAVVLGILSSWLISARVQAQGETQDGLIDAFTFFIPYSVDRLDEQFNAGRSPLLNITEIEVIISIAVHRDNTIIYYDEWEDGLEPDLTNPTQFSTGVWGDNDPTNGIPPLFSTDVLTSGSVITLRNFVPVEYTNRDPNDPFLFDGGDVLTGGGGALAIILTFWPVQPSTPGRPGILYADAWELYPTDRWDTDYIIPIGQDLAGLRAGFKVVGLNVQAVKENTTILIDIDGDGVADLTQTLDYGEQYNTINGVNSGARVQASAPVQVQVFASDPAQTYEARGYTIVPVRQWTGDYLAPRSSDGDFWLYNPDPTSTLELQVQTITNTSLITVPSMSTAKFPPAGLINTPTGIRFTSPDGRPFAGLVALDDADAQDWGYDVLPIANLTSQMLVGMGLGNNNNPGPPPRPDGDESPVYVTVMQATTIFVDYDNDGNPDFSRPVAPLAEVAITDPDHDLTGAFIYTQDDTPFAAAWGQDQNAPPADPSIDAGAGITPLRSLLIQKTFQHIENVNCDGLITPDDTIRFRLEYFNNSVNSISNLILTDVLPSGLTYVPNSIIHNGLPVPDDTGSPLFSSTGYHAGTIAGLESAVLTFDTLINSTSDVIVNRVGVRAQNLPLDSDTVAILIPAGVITPVLELDASLLQPADGVIMAGQTITFGMTITNTGSASITKLPMRNDFSESYLTFRSAVPPADVTATGTITWTDLGQLPPGETTNLAISFTVNQTPPTPADVVNRMTIVGALRSDSPKPLVCSTEARVNVPSPTPTPTRPPGGDDDTPVPPTETPFGTPPATTTGTPPATVTGTPPATVTGTPPATVTQTPPPGPGIPPVTPPPPGAPTPAMPVVSLPETGAQNLQFRPKMIGNTFLGLILVGVSFLAFLFRRRSK